MIDINIPDETNGNADSNPIPTTNIICIMGSPTDEKRAFAQRHIIGRNDDDAYIVIDAIGEDCALDSDQSLPHTSLDLQAIMNLSGKKQKDIILMYPGLSMKDRAPVIQEIKQHMNTEARIIGIWFDDTVPDAKSRRSKNNRGKYIPVRPSEEPSKADPTTVVSAPSISEGFDIIAHLQRAYSATDDTDLESNHADDDPYKLKKTMYYQKRGDYPMY